MGRYEAQHLFLKGSSLILYTTVTSAERGCRGKHEERAEVNRVGQQRKDTEGTKQGHPKHRHSPLCCLSTIPPAEPSQAHESPVPAPCQLLQGHRNWSRELAPCPLGKQSLEEPESLISLLLNRPVINQEEAFLVWGLVLHPIYI